MLTLLGLLIFGLIVFAVATGLGLASNWFVTLPLAALCAVMFAAIWFNAAKRS